MAKKQFVSKKEWLDVGKIKPSKNNPRKIKTRAFRDLVKGLKKFPQMLELRPPVVDEDGKILGGEQRYRAAIEAGMKKIPVERAIGLTKSQKEEFMIKDNGHAGEWDTVKLMADWDIKKLADWGLSLTMPDEMQKVNGVEYPLVPEFDEEYNSIVIICKTKTEYASIKSKLGIGGKRQSYKKNYLGETDIAFYEELKLD